MQVVAHAVRSGIAALNVVTAALDADPRTRDVDVVFARGREEVARAIAAGGPTVVAWSFYSPGARPTAIAADVAAAIARLESRGAAYGQWRQQAQIAGELVQLRTTRRAHGRPGGAGSNPR